MTRTTITALAGLALMTSAGTTACALKRPDTPLVRMIEPQLFDAPSVPSSADGGATSLRLLDTGARGHIGRRLIHRHADGELVEDVVWRWSSRPDRYLDSAVRLALASSEHVTLVDAGAAPTMAVTLVEWDLDADGSQLVGAAEIELTGSDRVVRTAVVRGTQPVSSELPGNLAEAAGRLLRALASDCVARATERR